MPSKRKTKDKSAQVLEPSLPADAALVVDTQKEILLSPETTSLVIQTENIQESSQVIPKEQNTIPIPDSSIQNIENRHLSPVDEQKVPKSKKSKETSTTKPRKSKKSQPEETIQQNVEKDMSLKDQSNIVPQMVAETSKESSLKAETDRSVFDVSKTTEAELNYESEYKKLKANFTSVKDDLKSKELAIKELKSEIESLRKKIKSYEKLEALDQGTNLWKEAAYGMSQFIADKTGYTQSQILKKFGVEDD